jgi:long-chain acyl-CoA synthetase
MTNESDQRSGTSGANGGAETDAAPPPWLRSYPPNINWYMSFPTAPLFSLMDDAVKRFPKRPFTNFLGQTQTFSEIGAAVDRAAAGLQRLGVKKGSKVGLFLPNSPTFIVYYYAILKAGGTVVNFNPLYSLDELTFQIEDSGTEIMVTLDLELLYSKVESLLESGSLKQAIVCSFPALLPAAKSVLFKLFRGKELSNLAQSPARKQVVLEADVLGNAADLQVPAIDPLKDIAVLQYTGGTTGSPKGAMLTHANVHTNTLQVVSWAPELEDGAERVFGALPFFHVFAMTVVMNFSVAKGSEIIIMPKFEINEAMKLLDKAKPTAMPGVPTLFNAIMNHPKLKSYDLSSLKFCLSGGAPLLLETKRRFESLTGCKVVEGYGLSETSPVATCNPIDGPPRDRQSIGLPVPGTTLSLRDLEDPTIEVPQGERGEICIKGPQVMAGYWNRPDATKEVFVGDFLRTGDVAIMHEDGFFEIVDRTKDMIISSGFNVYPRHVEEAISTHPAVDEVTVIGIPHEKTGESPKAFIKLKDGQSASAEDILTHLEQKLAKRELPTEIEFRSELPKTMIGKLSKKELKEEEARKRAEAQG